jgi:hypothetical protein
MTHLPDLSVQPAPPARAGLARWVAPSFSDLFFLSLMVWLFMLGAGRWNLLLLDGDTGWHIRTGEYVLDHGSVPKGDLFSFSKPGQPWFAWEWGADVVYALLYRAFGLKGVVLFAGGLVALFATLLIRLTLARGANLLFALVTGLLAVGASTIHYLARPHLFTLVLVPLVAWVIERDQIRRDRVLWLLVPLAAIWTNLHGGFLVLIACTGLAAGGAALEAVWQGERWAEGGAWARARRLATVTVLCALATLANPYGYHLHLHAAGYLRSDWIREVVAEFQSPSFRKENILQYEVLLLAGLLTAGLQLGRRSVTGPLWILFWAHQSLGSERHITVYSSLAAPFIAIEATRVWKGFLEGAGRTSIRRILDNLAHDTVPQFRWTSLWPVAALAGLLAIDLGIRWPQDFPAERFPVGLVAKHQQRILGARVLTTDQWADYLIYRFYPHHKVFFDGRSDFYGPELGREYLRLCNGQHDWRDILDRHGFNVALIPANWSLASLLKQETAWRVVDDDGKTLVFERRPPEPANTQGEGRTPPKKGVPPLMNPRASTEIPKRDCTEMKAVKRTSRGQGTQPGEASLDRAALAYSRVRSGTISLTGSGR